MIKLEALPESHPEYKNGLRYTMRVNNFVTFYLTVNSAKQLLTDLTKLMERERHETL